ncbi:MAG: GntR family transcriptional regulator [Burkholderiales bacterium]
MSSPLRTPVERFSRAEWVAETLRERIIDGTYAPGERIREAQLQEEFALSNGPIREALQRIVADGLAERAPWQGVRVIALSEEEVVHLFGLRSALLEYAAECAARHSGPADAITAAALRKLLARKHAAARAGRPEPVTGATTDWVIAVAANPQIAAVWRTTMLRSRIYVHRSMRRTAGAETGPVIERLIAAILDREPQAARKAAREFNDKMLAGAGLSTGKKVK